MLILNDEEFARVCGGEFCQDLLEKADECSYAGDDRKQLEKRVDAVFRVRLKVYFPQGDIKVLSVPQRINFAMLHCMLADRYQEDNPELDEVAFKVHYLDPDEDKIRITNDSDWRECLDMKRSQPAFAGTLGATVAPRPGEFKLELHLDYHFGATTMVKRSTTHATPATSTHQSPSVRPPQTQPAAAPAGSPTRMPPTGGGPARRHPASNSQRDAGHATSASAGRAGAEVGMVYGAGVQHGVKHGAPQVHTPPPVGQQQAIVHTMTQQAAGYGRAPATQPGLSVPPQPPAPSQPVPVQPPQQQQQQQQQPSSQPQGRWGAPSPQHQHPPNPQPVPPPASFSSGGAVTNSPKAQPVALPANSRWGRGGGGVPFMGLPEVPDESFIQEKGKHIDELASRAAPPPVADPYPHLSLDDDEDVPDGPTRWDEFKSTNANAPGGVRQSKYRRAGAGRDELPKKPAVKKKGNDSDAHERPVGEVRRVSAGAQGFRRIRDLPPNTPPDAAAAPPAQPSGPQFSITGKAVK
eukprot:TRINITY_DN3660_c0_g1_i2.p1 TRINITY_DN3660_c0_g1~~TRINITY_DN3660_c0_g1_i2.p1  ORF type:complete len:522 (+),score=97.29 TRINITY_DN3660_c0_g1_i2:1611-3176(+)